MIGSLRMSVMAMLDLVAAVELGKQVLARFLQG